MSKFLGICLTLFLTDLASAQEPTGQGLLEDKKDESLLVLPGRPPQQNIVVSRSSFSDELPELTFDPQTDLYYPTGPQPSFEEPAREVPGSAHNLSRDSETYVQKLDSQIPWFPKPEKKDQPGATVDQVQTAESVTQSDMGAQPDADKVSNLVNLAAESRKKKDYKAAADIYAQIIQLGNASMEHYNGLMQNLDSLVCRRLKLDVDPKIITEAYNAIKKTKWETGYEMMIAGRVHDYLQKSLEADRQLIEEKASELYRKKDYKAAADIYAQIIQWEDPKLHHYESFLSCLYYLLRKHQPLEVSTDLVLKAYDAVMKAEYSGDYERMVAGTVFNHFQQRAQ